MKPVFTRSVREELMAALWMIVALLARQDKDLQIMAYLFAFVALVNLVASIVHSIKDK